MELIVLKELIHLSDIRKTISYCISMAHTNIYMGQLCMSLPLLFCKSCCLIFKIMLKIGISMKVTLISSYHPVLLSNTTKQDIQRMALQFQETHDLL